LSLPPNQSRQLAASLLDVADATPLLQALGVLLQ